MRQLKISKSITNRDSASLERFLSDISKVQMIGADEEVELARKIRAGDEDALNKLVTTNLRFVVSVVHLVCRVVDSAGHPASHR